jgi:Asp-tRNA(Asn)/Glu-tRNA(Gln) amidotransferase A subunit family amidase
VRRAAFCGTVGLKPTYGRLSLRGVFPLAPTLDHAGHLTRTVRDAALVWDVLRGATSNEEEDADGQALSPTDRLLQHATARAWEIGWVKPYFFERADDAMRAAWERALELAGQQGSRIRRIEADPGIEEAVRQHRCVMAAEAAAIHQARFRHCRETYPPKIASLIEEGLSTTATAYLNALEYRRRFARRVKALLQELDAILVPAAPGAAPDRSTTGDLAFQAVWSFIGVPVLCLPVGLSPEGLPLGLQVITWKNDEPKLLSLAFWLESILAAESSEPENPSWFV